MVVAMLALPAVATAGEWGIHTSKVGLPLFTVGGKDPKLTAQGEPNIECGQVTGQGSYVLNTTGSVFLTFTGCTESFTWSPCTTSGQGAGSITTGWKEFHNIHLEPTNANTNAIGILITGGVGSQDVATFTCKPFGVTTTITITGNVIGELTGPTCGGTATKSGSINFETRSAVKEKEPTQKWEQDTTIGTIVDLVEDVTAFGSTTEHTAALDASWTVTYNDAATATCL
jgi:hypothetical protein